MTNAFLKVEVDGPVVHVRLNRPDKRNAMSGAMVRELQTAFVNLPGEARVAVISGEGAHFSAGLDLSEVTEQSVAEGIFHSRMWHAAFDQIQCILRPVGTYGVADELTGISELRQDMVTPAQGNELDGKGYNPPSLLGVNTGAPYLHAGQAASLESLFSETFRTHFAALSPNFLTDVDANVRKQQVRQLVAYLLSIDADAEVVNAPVQAGAAGGDFCAAP